MIWNGIEVEVRNRPAADPGFIPLGLYMDAFLKGASRPVSIAVERENGNIDRKSTRLNSSHSRKSRMPSSA